MRLALFLLLAWTGLAAAHEVHHAVQRAAAVAVRLSYADGQPFAYEKYELYAVGKDVAVQVGNSDAEGRVVFLPGEVRDWRLKSYSADGHGVDLRFAVPLAVGGTPAVAGTAESAGPDRTTRIVVGLSILFGLFGLLQLFLRRRKS
jgi:nickel transport protein